MTQHSSEGPDSPSGSRRADIAPLIDIMARLRNRERGCPWDVEQTFATIAPYTIEEAYEVADAIERCDMSSLVDELGDLLFQVAFHARMAEEAGHFDFADVIDAICAKMIRRHPHVFADGSSKPDWEAIKADERQGADDCSAMAGVARSLPALMRSEKLQKRASRTGFDWPDADGAFEKIIEEIEEVKEASSQVEREEEIGDLLFAVVNWARHLGVSPEAAMRLANDKFEKRFRAMEKVAGAEFGGLSLDAKEKLWTDVKKLE
jgi:nucleoside triphosphate diphosphatase